jgi:two-component system, NarL family, nitrate/nitrite response regulator NarL
MAIRVLLVDDHALFREAAAHVLSHESDIEIVGICGTLEEALKVTPSVKVDIVLLDYDLHGRRGTEFVGAARLMGFTGKVLIVTAGLPDRDLQSCFYQGVSGVCLKEQPLPILLRAIRAVAEGRTWYDQRQMQTILSMPQAEGSLRFSERERDILRGIVDGLGNKEIADRLNVSETSVKAGVQRLFEKAGVRSRGGLVRAALEKYREALG